MCCGMLLRIEKMFRSMRTELGSEGVSIRGWEAFSSLLWLYFWSTWCFKLSFARALVQGTAHQSIISSRSVGVRQHHERKSRNQAACLTISVRGHGNFGDALSQSFLLSLSGDAKPSIYISSNISYIHLTGTRYQYRVSAMYRTILYLLSYPGLRFPAFECASLDPWSNTKNARASISHALLWKGDQHGGLVVQNTTLKLYRRLSPASLYFLTQIQRDLNFSFPWSRTLPHHVWCDDIAVLPQYLT